MGLGLAAGDKATARQAGWVGGGAAEGGGLGAQTLVKVALGSLSPLWWEEPEFLPEVENEPTAAWQQVSGGPASDLQPLFGLSGEVRR